MNSQPRIKIADQGKGLISLSFQIQLYNCVNSMLHEISKHDLSRQEEQREELDDMETELEEKREILLTHLRPFEQTYLQENRIVQETQIFRPFTSSCRNLHAAKRKLQPFSESDAKSSALT
jgi:hypothetical protein